MHTRGIVKPSCFELLSVEEWPVKVYGPGAREQLIAILMLQVRSPSGSACHRVAFLARFKGEMDRLHSKRPPRGFQKLRSGHGSISLR
jgi:hypothetical protein